MLRTVGRVITCIKLPILLVFLGYLSFLALLIVLKYAVASLKGGELIPAAARIAFAATLTALWLYAWRSIACWFRNRYLKTRYYREKQK